MSELLKYLPGRLDNPDLLLNLDKRLDPRILASAVTKFCWEKLKK